MEELSDYAGHYDYAALIASLTAACLLEEAQRLFSSRDWQRLFILAIEHDIEDLALYLFTTKKCILPLGVAKKSTRRFIASQEPGADELAEIVGGAEGLHLEVSGSVGQVYAKLSTLQRRSRYGKFVGQWGWQFVKS
jgi:hypothetical protein